MSDIVAPTSPIVPTAARKQNINNVERDLYDIEAGGHRITFRKLDAVDSWNLMAVAPANAPPQWRSMALLTMAIEYLDGRPVSMGSSEHVDLQAIAKTMRGVGMDGLSAIGEALSALDPVASAPDPEAAHRAQVGNFCETAASDNLS